MLPLHASAPSWLALAAAGVLIAAPALAADAEPPADPPPPSTTSAQAKLKVAQRDAKAAHDAARRR